MTVPSRAQPGAPVTDGFVLFAGSYASVAAAGIHAFVLRPDGTLERLGEWSGVPNPSYLAVRGSANLYAVGETGMAGDGSPGSVHAFRIERGNAGVDLAPIGMQSTEGDHPCHLGIDRGGRWLVASNYSTGNASVHPLDEHGHPGSAVTLVQHAGSGARPDRQAGPHVHSAIFTADNRSLILADLGIDRLVVYTFDDETGGASRRIEVEAVPGSGPRHMALHPGGDHLFVVNELDNTLTWYRMPDLRAQQSLATVPPGVRATSAADVKIAGSGRFVYVSNRGHDSVAVFSFDPTDGLRSTAIRPCGGSWPRGFAISPDGRYLVVANRHSGSLDVIPVRDGGADLSDRIATAEVVQASCVTFMPHDMPGERPL